VNINIFLNRIVKIKKINVQIIVQKATVCNKKTGCIKSDLMQPVSVDWNSVIKTIPGF
jgi:hypothetical protein